MKEIPIIGSPFIELDRAGPMDIVHAMFGVMPHYAQAVGQHVRQTEMMLAECKAVLKGMGVTQLRRADMPERPAGSEGENDGPGA